ncbi:electron transfer flavoprotein subunit beta/FixA family protein [Lysinibacillus endophyticus]|mgnify:CR=1 FL=1|uniref:electron transfer flavoprotein subunit beta/FixA family protein n=1 Tax=Ureibacillus endophyticus TaxID=1978490 RepID=UPI00209C7AFF|nr:electron transfer flavoprotein subunit beta/FixA family protein [Lysinibacillus endophyticus]MCP1146675.1 electron transfer flavoprotein subunit beta/FixA family protein [Lysinibacillus endophyticus]
MNIFVLLKRTFDTEEKIVIKNGAIQDDAVEYIINPYDEYAIEEAILQRDQHGGKVTVVTLGDEETNKQLRTALAMGADEAVLINDEDLDEGDAWTTANILASYLKDKEPSLILAGNMAIDGGSGQVGPLLAELLNISAITSITNLKIDGTKAKIERDVEGDKEIVEVALPVLVTCQQGLNEPRYPSLPGIMKAKKKPIEELELDDLDIEVESHVETLDVFLPEAKPAGRILAGEIPQQVEELVNLLRTEAKVL